MILLNPILEPKKFFHAPKVRLVFHALGLFVHVFLVWSVASQFFFQWDRQMIRCIPRASNLLMPVEAVRFLQKHNFSGNIYGEYNNSGYIGYHLYPQSRIFIHSLALWYSVKHYKYYERITEAKINLNALILDYNIRAFVLAHHNLGEHLWLIQYLYHSRHWVMIYVDESTTIFVRREDSLARLALSSSHLSQIQYIPRIARSARRLVTLGNFFLQIGNLSESRAAFRSALQNDPRQATAWNNLGVIASKEGDYPQALAFYIKSVESDLQFRTARQNISRLFQQKLRFDPANPCHKKAMSLGLVVEK
jgi:tetratricopeptide (TPR) repeat protein